MALTNCQYLAAQVNQLLWRDLEELVPWECLAELHEVTGVVRTRRVLAQLNCTGDGLANNRNRSRRVGIRGRRQQSDEPQFTRHFAFRVELLDPDVVKVGRAVHGGSAIRLCDDQQLRLTSLLLDLRR